MTLQMFRVILKKLWINNKVRIHYYPEFIFKRCALFKVRIELCLQLDWRVEYINSVGNEWAYENQGQVWDRGGLQRDRDRKSTALTATCPLIAYRRRYQKIEPAFHSHWRRETRGGQQRENWRGRITTIVVEWGWKSCWKRTCRALGACITSARTT